MHTEETPLVTLFRHNRWANLRLLDACLELSDEQLDSTMIGSFGTIRITLFHIVSSEDHYLFLVTGQPHDARLARGQQPSLIELRELASAIGERLCRAAAAVTASDMTYPVWDGKTWPVPAATILTQSINHSTEHRTQISAILTQLGIEPPEMDGWTYYLTVQIVANE